MGQGHDDNAGRHSVDDAIAEYCRLRDSGEPPDLDTFILKWPDCADELREFVRRDGVFKQLLVDDSVPPESAVKASQPDTNSVATGETFISGTASDSARASMPSEFGRYEIRGVLGQGGMGTVYRAWNADLQHEVALKIPKLEGPKAEERKERFYREARSAVSLRHGNICRVYDLNEVDGQPFIAMEYVEGKTLSHFFGPENPLSEKKAAAIIRRLALALDHAHERGVVHRDLKPANIMISAETKEPIIMDFGLARLENEKDSEDLALTQEGAILGTPSYMSPEQVEADPDLLGPQTDIYSLGIILYEMLTGTVPFVGPLGSVIASILNKEPESISDTRPQVSPGLVSICEKMMAKTLDERYASMRDVANDLQRFLKSDQSAPKVQRAEKPSELTAGRLTGQAWTWLTTGSPIKLPLVVAGLASVLIMLAVVLMIPTKHGTVRIEIPDPSLSLSIDGNTFTVSNTQKPAELRSGTHDFSVLIDGQPLKLGDTVSLATTEHNGEYRLSIRHGGVELTSSKFVLAKGADTALVVELVRQPATSTDVTSQQTASTVSINQPETRHGIRFEHVSHHYPFDGSVRDSMNAAHGAKSGDVSPNGPPRAGSGSLSCAGRTDGVLDGLKITNAAKSLSGDFSLAGWVWMAALPNQAPRIFSVITKTGDSNQGQSDMPYDLFVGARYTAFACSAARIQCPALTRNEWHHFTVTKHSDEIALFVDGEKVGDAKNTTVSTPRDLLIGALESGQRDFEGLIDEVTIFNRALDEQAVKALFADPSLVTDLINENTTIDASFERRAGGHEDVVRDAKWFPDSERLATVSHGNSIRVWNVETGEIEQELCFHEGVELATVAVSADGNQIATAANENTADGEYQEGDIVLWKNGVFQGVIGKHPQPKDGMLRNMNFSPDGRILASAGGDGAVRLWNTDSKAAGHVLRHMTPPDDQRAVLSEVRFTPDEKHILTTAQDSTLKLWAVATGQEVRTYFGHTDHVLSTSFSGREEFISGGLRDGDLRIWNINDSSLSDSISVPGYCRRISTSPDGRVVGVASQNYQNAILIDRLTRKRLFLHGHTAGLFRCRFSPDGTRLAVTSFDKSVSIWNIDRRRNQTVAPNEPVSVMKTVNLAGQSNAIGRGWEWNPDGSLTVSRTDGGAAILLRCPTTLPYRLQADFTVNGASSASRFGFNLPVGYAQTTFVFCPRDASQTGLENTATQPVDVGTLEFGRRYQVVFDVHPGPTRSRLSATLDGKQVFEWEGENSRLVHGPTAHGKHRDLRIGLQTDAPMSVTIHDVTIQSDEFRVVRASVSDDTLHRRQELDKPDYAALATGTWRPIEFSDEEIAALDGQSLSPGTVQTVADGLKLKSDARHTWFNLPDLRGRDVIFRTRVHSVKTCWYIPITVRRAMPAVGVYGPGIIVRCDLKQRFLEIGSYRPPGDTKWGSAPLEQLVSPSFELAIAAVGDRITGYIDGHKVVDGVDLIPEVGDLISMGIRRSGTVPAEAVFESPEVMILDPPDEQVSILPRADDESLYFDGRDDAVVLHGLQYDGTENITIEGWVTPIATYKGERMLFSNTIGKGLNVHTDCSENPAVWRALFYAGPGENSAKLTAPLVSGSRTHLTFTYGKQHIRLFIDGRVVASEKLSALHNPADIPFFVGAEPRTVESLQFPSTRSLIHQVRFSRGVRYEGDFTPEDQLESDSNTLALYRNGHIRNNTWQDLSGNGHHGQIIGARLIDTALGAVADALDSSLQSGDKTSVTLAGIVNVQVRDQTFLPLTIDRRKLPGFLRAELVNLPPELTADAVIIPPDVNGARVSITASGDVRPGQYNGQLIVRSAESQVTHPVTVNVVENPRVTAESYPRPPLMSPESLAALGFASLSEQTPSEFKEFDEDSPVSEGEPLVRGFAGGCYFFEHAGGWHAYNKLSSGHGLLEVTGRVLPKDAGGWFVNVSCRQAGRGLSFHVYHDGRIVLRDGMFPPGHEPLMKDRLLHQLDPRVTSDFHTIAIAFRPGSIRVFWDGNPVSDDIPVDFDVSDNGVSLGASGRGRIEFERIGYWKLVSAI